MNKLAFGPVFALALVISLPAHAITNSGYQLDRVNGSDLSQPVMAPYYYDVNEGSHLTFTEGFDYPVYQSDFLEIIHSNLPTGAQMDYASGYVYIESKFDWTPDYCQSDSQSYHIIVDLWRNSLWWMKDDHYITVHNVNRPPQITSEIPATRNINVGGNFHLDIMATDADMLECHDDSLTMNYSAGQLISATFIDLGLGSATFDWIPNASEIGLHVLTFSATDQNQGSDSRQLQVQVYLCGDVNNDKSVNVGDAVFLISYVFKGGAAPDPVCVGDVNGDDGTNVGDVVYLIAYVFKGGAPPVVPCCP